MKEILLLAFAAITTSFSFAQTAVDFTATDCANNSHNLFTELNSGKVIVICWVMPCSGCTAAAATAAATVKNMANPNVVFYLLDDEGNTDCSTLKSWCSTNKIATTAIFDNANDVIKMTDYGAPGMPKTVVLGGGLDHKVFYSEEDGLSQTALQTAINKAITTGIKDYTKESIGLDVFPNPGTSTVKINYTLTKSADANIEIMNELGEKVSATSLGNQSPGMQEYELNIETLSVGVYFIKINAGTATQTTKLTVIR